MTDLSRTIHGVFLVQYGLFFELPNDYKITGSGTPCTDKHLQALDVMLAEKFNVSLSTSMHEELSTYSIENLFQFWIWFERVWKDAGLMVKNDENMVAMFSDFPNNLPESMGDLWIKRFLTLFEPAEGDCIICHKKKSLVTLEPCQHIVCSHCFPGYTGCPVCGRPVDPHSTFLKNLQIANDPDRKAWKSMRRIDMGKDIESFARQKFNDLCQIAQAITIGDENLISAIIQAYPEQMIKWFPEKFASKQLQAIILSSLIENTNQIDVEPILRKYIKNATDLLRLIAVMSGEDGTLMPHKVHRDINAEQCGCMISYLPKCEYDRIDKFIKKSKNANCCINIIQTSYCFNVVKMSKSRRRLFLSILDSFEENALIEDFYRHKSLWIRVGEFLHPGNYEKRYSTANKAFLSIRKHYIKKECGKIDKFRTWRSRLETAIEKKDIDELEKLMRLHPGEFARHIDRILRGFGTDDCFTGFASTQFKTVKNSFLEQYKNQNDILAGLREITKGVTSFLSNAASELDTRITMVSQFTGCIAKLSTPMLIQLWGHFGSRDQKSKRRIFYPAGCSRKIYWKDDNRFTISSYYLSQIREAIEKELLMRFSKCPHFEQSMIDESIQTLTFPFNERTNFSKGIRLSAGSSLKLPSEDNGGKLRLFLHWCQKEKSRRVDLDLSVGFYSEDWKEIATCTYYQLQCASSKNEKDIFARHSGDFQEAPYPGGATEYVDINRTLALSEGIRYAVVLVTVFAGVDFCDLERAYSGVMFRDQIKNTKQFDPLTVRFKYQLDGETNSYVPIVFDIKEERIHDIQCFLGANGRLCNYDSNRNLIRETAQSSMEYFSSHPRAMRYDIALLHAAVRSNNVWIRLENGKYIQLTKRPDENDFHFYQRLVRRHIVTQNSQDSDSSPDITKPTLAFLLDGEVELNDESEYYLIFEGRLSERHSWLEMAKEI